MPLSPAAVGIIFNEDRTQVLLIKREDVPIWVLPGGGIDAGETAEEAVIREIEEETGLHIEIQRKCAEYIPVNKLASLTHVFICQCKAGVPILSSETSAICFFPLNQLPSSFFKVHLQWLDDALTYSTLVRKPLTQVNYWELGKYFFRHPWHSLRYAMTRRGCRLNFKK